MDIKKISKEFQDINSQLKLILVGSLARGEDANDIDYITHLRLPNDKKIYRTEYKGVKIDIFKVPNIEIGKFMRTQPKHRIIAIHKGLKKNGYKLTPEGLFNLNTNKKIPFTPAKVWKLAGLKGEVGGEKKSTHLQSILFDVNKWTLKKALKWFKDHNFKLPEGKLPHTTSKYHRLRVQHPQYNKYFYRTKELGNGIYTIVGIPK